MSINYFLSYYEPVRKYSRNWYGILEYAPDATILLYDDSVGVAIGHMESDIPVYDWLIPLEEADALDIVDTYPDGDGIYKGEKLEKRWVNEEEYLEEE